MSRPTRGGRTPSPLPLPRAPRARPGRGMVGRRLLTLAGLTALAGLGAGVVWWQSRHHADEAAAGAAAKRLFAWRADEVVELALTNAQGTVTMQHRAGEQNPWRIREPRATAAEGLAVDSLLRTVLDAEVGGQVPGTAAGGHDLALFGLEAPRITLSLTGPDNQREVLEVGHKNTFDDTLFVRRRGRQEVAICPASVEQALDKSFLDLRDKRVVTLPSTTYADIVVEAEGAVGYTLGRRDESWRLSAPIDAAADRAQADALVGALSGLRAKQFVAELGDDPALLRAHGLDRPLYRATITDDTQARAVLRVGRRPAGPSDVFYAQIEPAGPIVELGSDWVVKKLSIGLWELRDRHLASFTQRDVARLSLAQGGQRLVAVREAAADDGGEVVWQGEAASAAAAGSQKPSQPLDRHKVAALLQRIHGLQASGVVAEQSSAELAGSWGLTTPDMHIVLEGELAPTGEGQEARPRLAELRLSAVHGGERLVLGADAGPVWRIGVGDLEGVEADLGSLAATPPAPPATTAAADGG